MAEQDIKLKIYNSLKRQKEDFIPINKGKVGLYVCGPTVYGPPHVGHARSYVNFDIVRRYLEYIGYKVKYVQNITDVGHLVGDGDDGEDKIAKQAVKEDIDPYEIAYKYETIYFDMMDRLNIKRPSISSRATGFIPEIIEFIKTLIDKGYAYVTKNNNVYYEVSKFKNYGSLSNRSLDNNISGERIKIASDKKKPEDFALWKKAENGHIMKWDSPWGEGYPGWHLECSTMSKKFLGETFDIHGGGLDNIFPHHECEIAQSESCNGVKFVNYFMHNNLITVNGTKMGKSLGNFVTLEELFKTFDAMVVRYFIMQFHYRSPIDFSTSALERAKAEYSRIEEAVKKVRKLCTNYAEVTDVELLRIDNSFTNAMCEDFNTPVAIAEVLNLVKFINKTQDINLLAQTNTLIARLLEDVLGLSFATAISEKVEIPAEIVELANKRWLAKSEKNWAQADEFRASINALGFDVIDKKHEYEIVKK